MALDRQSIYQGFQDTADAEMGRSNSLSDFFGWTHHGETARNIDVAGLEYLANSYEAQVQRDWLTDMWNKNNEYNTPMAQMARARAAGLNPNLLYGQPIAESQPASGGAEGSVGVGNPAVAGSGAARDISTLAALSAQTDLMRAQADATRSRIPVNREQVNNLREATNNLVTQGAILGLDLSKYQAVYDNMIDTLNMEYESKREGYRFDVDKLNVMRSTLEDTVFAQRDEIVNRAKEALANAERAIAQRDMTIEQKKLLSQQVDQIKKLMEVYDQNIERLKKENKFITADKIFGYVFGTINASSNLISAIGTLSNVSGNNPTFSTNTTQTNTGPDLDYYPYGIGQ